MADYRLSPEAAVNIFELHDHIASDSPAAASEFVDVLFATFQQLAEFPQSGRLRPELAYLGTGLRSYPRGNYVILYRVIDGDVQIVYVVHGHRNFEDLLTE